MTFGAYIPPQAKNGLVPVLWYLSGLTCNWSNVMEKSGLQRVASELGIMIIAPDTSPRSNDGKNVPDDDAYDLGQGAGFYLNAVKSPWAEHFQMEDYLIKELPELVSAHLPANMERQGIFGHSMGGHGALTLFLKNQNRFKSVSAFAPIVAPSQVPWGQKAFQTYLGNDEALWANYDACALIAKGKTNAHILIDQGAADNFLEEQLKPHLFQEACDSVGQELSLNMREGYDHSYYFCLLYTSPSPRDQRGSRMPSSA